MIKLENIRKTFETNEDKSLILNNISLTINKGDIFGLVGKTGSGKSTLLRIMNGFINTNEGNVFYDGNVLNSKNRKSFIDNTSMIFQQYNLLSNLNVIDNVLLPLKIRKLKVKDYLNKATELLDFVGLNGMYNNKISTLSGGEKQRVAIARALITDPSIIFCDEPTSALDDYTTYEVLSLLKMINKKYNTTIIIVSHNINVIKSMCNRVALIENGEIKKIIQQKPTNLKFSTYEEAFDND